MYDEIELSAISFFLSFSVKAKITWSHNIKYSRGVELGEGKQDSQNLNFLFPYSLAKP